MKKNISLLMIFFTVSFSRFAPSRARTIFQENGGTGTASLNPKNVVRELPLQHAYIYIYAFRPICCLLFLAEATHFAFFGGKCIRIKDNKNAFLAHFGVQKCIFCCPYFFYVSHRKRQNVLFQLEKVCRKLV